MTFGSFTDSDLESDSESSNNNDFTNHSFTNFNFIDTSADSREVFADLYDGVTDPEVDENTTAIYHQICVIGGTSRQEDEASEAFDDLGNPYINPADLTRGLGNKYIGTAPREKVQLPQEVWDRAQRAMDGTEPMTTTATPQALQAYQYKIARSKGELEKQMAILDERRAAAAASNKCDKDFHKLSETFGMQAEYEASKLTTNYDVLPGGGRSLQEQAFDTSKNSKEVQIHPTDPKMTTSIASNLDSA
ncbi:hypothetical protein QYE76_019432 [Lolium multiflorum]|uniref:Uncharacterized protein n=1 Tax=Lolium multiflorum TaxID=4521 RepID=A0AAD8R4H3_LOLMU|nr:hypothetical protein QYE76_019432 [Lolium multiflorum]